MFWIILLLGVGAAYLVTDRAAGEVAGIVVVGIAVMGALWLNDKTGIENFIVGSWRTFSGVSSPNDIVRACDNPTGWVVVGVLVALLTAGLGLVAIVGIPVGLVVSVLGGLGVLVNRDEKPLKIGLAILALGVVGLILSGLGMRFMHYMDGSLVCPYGYRSALTDRIACPIFG